MIRETSDSIRHSSHTGMQQPEVCAYDEPVAWWEYVERVAGTTNQTEIARRVGLSQPSVNRWRTSLPKSENVITFAKAYGRPPLEALLAAGIVSDEDIEITHAPANLSEVETDTLLAEIRRRIKD
jgi:hypothetical protein